MGTFKPLTPVSIVDRDGISTPSVQWFETGQEVGLAGLAGNSKRDFVQPLAEPAYNFETDLELFRVLPWA